MAKRQSENGPAVTTDHAPSSRRQFIEVTSAAALSAIVPGAFATDLAGARSAVTFNPRLLPPIGEVWGWFETVNRGGPRYTGNDAHRKFVDFLESGMQEARLPTTRDTYTFPRWEGKKWSLKATPKDGRPVDLPVTFYYPHSGQTGPNGVTGPLVHVGTMSSDRSRQADLSGDLKGKIVVVDYVLEARDYNEWYQPFGFYTPDTHLDKYVSSVIAVETPLLTEYKKAGAAGVIISWANLSDGQATGQNMPFGRALQEMPALFVGRAAGAKLRQLAAAGATATLTLDADVFQGSKTDTLIATLPGAAKDEMLIIYTHTDGPNMVQENAGIGLVALAKYFSKVPQGSRKRTLVFALVTGHDTGAYVPSTRGFTEQHPDMIQKAAGSVAVEHLGCRAWRDDRSLQYAASGQDELTYAIVNYEPLARIVLESLPGTTERHVAVVKPKPKGRYLGLGGSLSRFMPTLGYYASPTYLNIVAPDGCMSKLSKPLMYGQLQALAKIIHKMDVTSAADLKGAPDRSPA